jgi:hypothetical protein
MVGPAYIVLPRAGGELVLGCLTGFCQGNYEMEPASGTGWPDLQDDGSIEG